MYTEYINIIYIIYMYIYFDYTNKNFCRQTKHLNLSELNFSVVTKGFMEILDKLAPLKVHQCRFENLPLYLSSYKNNTLKTPHS